MIRFAGLLDALIFTPSRNGKVRLLADYFAEVPDPERGWAVAAITRDLDLKTVKASQIKQLVYTRVDGELFDMSHDYVGDLAEAAALIWPEKPGQNYVPTLPDVVETLNSVSRPEALRITENWFDALDASGRWALIKLATGGLRIGVAARLVKVALAEYGDVPVQEIEELWHGLEAPYTDLFAWLEGGEKPVSAAAAPFRPVMLSHPIEEADKPKIDLAEMAAEWKWDGIRVQAVREGDTRRLYSRTGDDIGAAFPDLLAAMPFDAAIDGELLVFDPEVRDRFAVRPFNDLQQRLNRKTVSQKLMASNPVFVRAYDMLWCAGEDLRALPWSDRRAKLERLLATEHTPNPDGDERFDLSEVVALADWDALAKARAEPPLDAIEGVMLKKRSAVYVPGRPKGEWWKWKREPFLVDAVMMYAQRGHGKRSSFYSDYTFGVWKEIKGKDELVPVGKAYHGFTDQELKKLDRYVRDNTTARYGPVRSVTATKEQGMVLEIAFEGLARSPRHKSGVSMRFPRISRLRWDKPSAEADRIEMLEGMLESQGA